MALPSSEQTYGSPPYHESALKAALRLLGQNAQFAFQGLGAVRPGSNFGDAFLQSSSAASRAAQEYALKQQQAAQQREHDRIWESQVEASKKPPPPPKPQKVDPWNMAPDEYQRYLNHQSDLAKAKAAGKPAKPGAAPKGPKPMKLPDRVMKRIELINMADPSNPAHMERLNAIIANPGTEQEKLAAEAKIRHYMNQNRR